MLRVYLAGIAFFALVLAGCSDSSQIPASGESINIGFFGDFSGESQVEGTHSLEGIQTIRQFDPLLNNGAELNIVVQEQGHSADESRRLLREFAKAQNLTALLIGSTSETILDLKEVIEEIEVPVIAIVATHSELTTGSGFINQLCFTDTQQANVAALFARDELLLRNAAIVYDPDSVYSTHLSTEFEKTYKATGGRIAGYYQTPVMEREKLENLASWGADLLYLPLSAVEVLGIVEQINDMDWSPEIMGTDGLLANVEKQFPDRISEIEGIYTTDLISYEGEFIVTSKLGKKASKVYEKTHGREADSYAVLGAEAYEILRSAMNRCTDPRNKKCINEKIRSTVNFRGGISRVSIDRQGRAKRPVFVNTIKKGNLEYVVKVY